MELDCEVIRDLLPLYAEHLTSPASTQLLEAHLESCESCRLNASGRSSGTTQHGRG